LCPITIYFKEPYFNFSGKDDLMTTGTLLEKLIVVHPTIKPVKAQLLYESYNGWIYSGRPHWRVDKVK
jgi:hypothetical protein